jgi:hemoglobin
MNRPLPPRNSRLHALLLCLSLAATSIGCAARAKHAPPSRATASRTTPRPATRPADDLRPLFDRLGGTPTITKVIEDFVATASTDPNVNFARKGQPQAWDATPEQVSLLKKRLVEFLSAATGGDTHYNGQDMVTAHRGMNITDGEFDALAADLKSALEKHGVPPREQSELLAVVNRTRSAIVATSPTANGAAPAAKAPEAPKPAPFVPTPITSNETELDPESPGAADQLNK